MLHLYRDVFRCLSSHEVRYLVIGGIAAVVHGVPRATFDLDVLIGADEENARRLLAALLKAGLGTADLTTPDAVLANEITVFRDRVRIDVQTRTPGLDFAEAWSRRRTVKVGNVVIEVVSLEDLIRAKTASARPVDLADVAALQEVLHTHPDRD